MPPVAAKNVHNFPQPEWRGRPTVFALLHPNSELLLDAEKKMPSLFAHLICNFLHNCGQTFDKVVERPK